MEEAQVPSVLFRQTGEKSIYQVPINELLPRNAAYDNHDEDEDGQDENNMSNDEHTKQEKGDDEKDPTSKSRSKCCHKDDMFGLGQG